MSCSVNLIFLWKIRRQKSLAFLFLIFYKKLYISFFCSDVRTLRFAYFISDLMINIKTAGFIRFQKSLRHPLIKLFCKNKKNLVPQIYLATQTKKPFFDIWYGPYRMVLEKNDHSSPIGSPHDDDGKP